MQTDRGSPWILLLVILAVLVIAALCFLPAKAHADTIVSGEFGALTQVGHTSSADFAWFGETPWGKPDARPVELFGKLRIAGDPDSLALCVDGRHTLGKRDWLSWEDRLAVRAELPLARSLIAFGGWERRYRISESRFVAGAKLVFGRGRGDD